MSRDELLTKLAMELAKWPVASGLNLKECDNGNGSIRWAWVYKEDTEGLSKQEWLDRRAELINKPSWDDLPSWADWVFQAPDGGRWYCSKGGKPECVVIDGRNFWSLPKESFEPVSKGCLPAGRDWRQTLEKRPVDEWEEGEARMDNIGRNGPTGDHYANTVSCRRCGGGYDPECHDECPCHILHAEYVDDHEGETPSAASIIRKGLGHMEDRASTYDKPGGERSMAATVKAFAATTGLELTEEQGWHFMALLKLVRSQQGGLRMDSYEDGAAYFALAGEAAAKNR